MRYSYVKFKNKIKLKKPYRTILYRKIKRNGAFHLKLFLSTSDQKETKSQVAFQSFTPFSKGTNYFQMHLNF